MISPVLGSISTRQLSSGVKMVILLYSVADMTGNGVSMGGNCYPLVFEMAKERDVFIRTPYVDDIPKGQSVSAFCVNNRRIVHTSDEYRKMCAYYSCDDFDEEETEEMVPVKKSLRDTTAKNAQKSNQNGKDLKLSTPRSKGQESL